ncbi:hypothetical protein AB1K91_07060 [Terribacillus sp. 179-K 1B1 HS]|uniref:hypothetical protein n=1 Tax=Terribacillus sp. 179-K 1B1 HS TaxID=3142388 RepID=UPI0039A3A615
MKKKVAQLSLTIYVTVPIKSQQNSSHLEEELLEAVVEANDDLRVTQDGEKAIYRIEGIHVEDVYVLENEEVTGKYIEDLDRCR